MFRFFAGGMPDGLTVDIRDFAVVHNAGHAVRVRDILGGVQIVHSTFQRSISTENMDDGFDACFSSFFNFCISSFCFLSSSSLFSGIMCHLLSGFFSLCLICKTGGFFDIKRFWHIKNEIILTKKGGKIYGNN